jgi:hypothetical protein
LVDERTGVIHDYSRRRGVEHSEIVAGAGIDIGRAELWNQAEAAERRKDSRVAREHLLALPHELDSEQRLALAREYAQELVERYGVAVDLAIHAPDSGGDQRNHHAHLLATTRCLNQDGLGEKSAIELSDRKRGEMGLSRGADEVKLLRERWEQMVNTALERAQVNERIDARSLADQGLEQVPQIHVGPMGTDQIRRGTPENSERATLNLEIQAANAQLRGLREQLAAERAKTAPEPLQEPQEDVQAREPTLRELRERRDASGAAVHRIDAEIRTVVDEREALSPLKFWQRHKLQQQIDQLVDRRHTAYRHYEKCAQRFQWAEDAPRREQAAGMAALHELAAELGPEEPQPQPQPEQQQRPTNAPTRPSEPSPRPSSGWDAPNR